MPGMCSAARRQCLHVQELKLLKPRVGGTVGSHSRCRVERGRQKEIQKLDVTPAAPLRWSNLSQACLLDVAVGF